jgi:hypothetical protein
MEHVCHIKEADCGWCVRLPQVRRSQTEPTACARVHIKEYVQLTRDHAFLSFLLGARQESSASEWDALCRSRAQCQHLLYRAKACILGCLQARRMPLRLIPFS